MTLDHDVERAPLSRGRTFADLPKQKKTCLALPSYSNEILSYQCANPRRSAAPRTPAASFLALRPLGLRHPRPSRGAPSPPRRRSGRCLAASRSSRPACSACATASRRARRQRRRCPSRPRRRCPTRRVESPLTESFTCLFSHAIACYRVKHLTSSAGAAFEMLSLASGEVALHLQAKEEEKVNCFEGC